MTAAPDDSGDLGDLERALDCGDMRSAGAAARRLIDAGRADDVLDATAACAQHSPAALTLLVETLDASGTVQRFAGTMLLDRTAVDDVAQDSLISVVESIGAYHGRGRFTSWVHTIVRRRVVDYLRRQRESTTLNEEESPAVRMSSMIATRATVRTALARIPELYRVPVVLRDLDALPYSEIAERLDRSVGTVKSQVSRGRAMVAAHLGDLPAESKAAQ